MPAVAAAGSSHAAGWPASSAGVEPSNGQHTRPQPPSTTRDAAVATAAARGTGDEAGNLVLVAPAQGTGAADDAESDTSGFRPIRRSSCCVSGGGSPSLSGGLCQVQYQERSPELAQRDPQPAADIKTALPAERAGARATPSVSQPSTSTSGGHTDADSTNSWSSNSLVEVAQLLASAGSMCSGSQVHSAAGTAPELRHLTWGHAGGGRLLATEPARALDQSDQPCASQSTPAVGQKRAWSSATPSRHLPLVQQQASKRSKSLMGEQVTAAQISTLFHMKLSDAAAAMGVGRTFFKKLCRKKGIHTWPHHTAIHKADGLQIQPCEHVSRGHAL